MSEQSPSPDAARAIFLLNQIGFKVTSDTGSYRLIRCFDSSQAQLYRLDGSTPTAADGLPVQGSGVLGNISDSAVQYDDVVIKGLELARAILADEHFRLTQMPRYQNPSIESRPYG
jgi:hypothetical protein